jgi:hypothetical protein
VIPRVTNFEPGGASTEANDIVMRMMESVGKAEAELIQLRRAKKARRKVLRKKLRATERELKDINRALEFVHTKTEE